MALHLNLYHETQKQRRARTRDPLRLGLLGLAVVMLGFIAYYFVRVAKVGEATTRLALVQTEWEQIEPRKKAAEAREAEIMSNIRVSELLVKHIEGRFHWGPVLDLIISTVPREVQITRMEATKPMDKTRNFSFVLTGVSTGTEPRQQAEDLRTALEQKLSGESKKVTSSFQQLEDAEAKVVIEGRALPTATFAIRLALTQEDAAVGTLAKRETK